MHETLHFVWRDGVRRRGLGIRDDLSCNVESIQGGGGSFSLEDF